MTTKDKASQGKEAIKQQATRAGAKIKSSGKAARKASRKAAESVDSYPVAALVGGLALGAVLGALLPRTRQEEDLLGSIGGAINERARNAAAAAREAGQAKLGELGISTDAAGKQVGKLIESFAKVAESAGSAAVDAARH
jgi:hypothetical protein